MFHHLCLSLNSHCSAASQTRNTHFVFLRSNCVLEASSLLLYVFFNSLARPYLCVRTSNVYIIWFFFSFKRFFEHGVRFLSPHTHVHTIDTVIRFCAVHNIEAETFRGAKEGDNATFRILYYILRVYCISLQPSVTNIMYEYNCVSTYHHIHRRDILFDFDESLSAIL